ncbi:MAG: hypothetical protein ACC645_08895 [Pirellulales bacterium]
MIDPLFSVGLPPLAVGQMWFFLPLLVAVSLVYSATRHEHMGPILIHAVRFAVWVVGFMAIILVVLMVLAWLT